MKKLNLREIYVQILKVFRLEYPTLLAVPYFYPFLVVPTTPSVSHLSTLCAAGGKPGILEGKAQKVTHRGGSPFASQQEITKIGMFAKPPSSYVCPHSVCLLSQTT